MDGKRAKTVREAVDNIAQECKVPFDFYGATQKDAARKPDTGMWKCAYPRWGLA